MAEPVEQWRQEKIQQLVIGDGWNAEYSFIVFRYKDGWHFYWKDMSRGPVQDLGRFFDEDHMWEMSLFMSGQWDKGIPIHGPKPEELV